MEQAFNVEVEPFEFSSEFDGEGEMLFESPLISHPRLGWGRVVPRGEVEEAERPSLIRHPRLGYGRVVRRGTTTAELDLEEPEILLPDERRLVTNTVEVPFRWICCLDLFFPDPDNASEDLLFRGSGTLISPRHVLTAGHNLFDEIQGSKGTSAVQRVRRVVVTPGRNSAATTAAGRAPLGTTISEAARTSRRWESSREDQFDFGLITLRDSIGARRQPSLGNRPLGFWGSRQWGASTRIRPREPSVLQGKPINISGYPGDKCRDQPPVGSASDAAIQACPITDWASAQWRGYGRMMSASPPAVPRMIFHDIDTFGGHSGSPVWLRWQQYRNLVAIHTAGRRRSAFNEGVRITSELLAEVRSWM